MLPGACASVPPEVRVLVSRCGTLGPWGCSGLYFKLIIFAVRRSMMAVLPWGGSPSAAPVLSWRCQKILAVSRSQCFFLLSL